MKNVTKYKKYINSRGFAGIIALTAVCSLVLILTFSLSASLLAKKQISKNLSNSIRSYYLAESGIEDAVYRKINGMILPTVAFNLDGASVSQTFSTIGENIAIDSVSNYANNYRKLRIVLEVTTTNISFHYGVQVGEGGLTMNNGSVITGNLYSNGSITRTSGSVATIFGDVFAATSIDGITVSETTDEEGAAIGGNAYANTIIDSVIAKDAYYKTIDDSTVSSSVCVNDHCHPGSDDPSAEAMPVSDGNIADWENDAVAAGNLDLSFCNPSDGAIIGPGVLDCDLTASSGTITLKGTVWVKGNITLDANMQLDGGFGINSGLLIADSTDSAKGKIDVSGFVCGSQGFNGSECNTPNGSYIMLISTHPGTADDAIYGGAHSDASVYYASKGKVTIKNQGDVKEVTGYMLNILQNARVSYQTGLINAAFTSGPGGGWEIVSWNETQ